ncbi:MAG TPA: aldolase [Methylocella sp.]|nr:aldolase [Methylocella sp.]
MSSKRDRPVANAEKSHLHASAVVIGEAGVLISGPSGAGKSSLAFALIAAAEEAGLFARLVGDDRITIESRSGRLIANGHPLILGKIEQRGHGIFEIPFLPAAVVRLVIGLAGEDEALSRYPKPVHEHIELAGVTLPFLPLRQDAPAAGLVLAVLANPRLRRILP